MTIHRSKEFFDQAERDLKHAETSLHAQMYDLACTSAQQSVENALRGVFQGLHKQSWGFSLRALLDQLEHQEDVPGEVRLALEDFEDFFGRSRDEELAWDMLYEDDSRAAIRQARLIVEFCKNYLAGS